MYLADQIITDTLAAKTYVCVFLPHWSLSDNLFWMPLASFLSLRVNSILTEQKSKAGHLSYSEKAEAELLGPAAAQLELAASCSSWHHFTADSVPESLFSSKNNSWH